MIRLGKREVLIETRLGVGGRVAALATNLIVLVFLSALIAGCGKSSTPGASEVKKIIRPRISQYGEILEIRKMNGEKFEIQGQKVYRLYYRAAAKFGKGWYWRTDDANLGWVHSTKISRNSKPLTGFGVSSDIKAIPEKSTYVEKGSIVFKMTDNGWVKAEESIEQFGFCPDKMPDQCYKSLKWEKE